MNRAIDRLQNLRVADVMREGVVSVSAHQSMTEAAKKLEAHEISGAVVVDSQRQCVGMLSALDFVRREARRGGIGTSEGSAQQTSETEWNAHALVESHMTRAVKSIGPEAPLFEAARVMCESHIHRLPVLDASGRAVGMITSMDLVAAMVHAMEEQMEVTHERRRTHSIHGESDSH